MTGSGHSSATSAQENEEDGGSFGLLLLPELELPEPGREGGWLVIVEEISSFRSFARRSISIARMPVLRRQARIRAISRLDTTAVVLPAGRGLPARSLTDHCEVDVNWRGA